MLNYRNLEIGQHILFTGKEPPDFKPFEEECVVIEKHTDHAIAQYEDVKVWIDDDTANLFYTLEKKSGWKNGAQKRTPRAVGLIPRGLSNYLAYRE